MENSVDFVVIDTAHGDASSVLKAVEDIKRDIRFL